MGHTFAPVSELDTLEAKQNHRSFSAQMVKISQCVNRGPRQISPGRFHKGIVGKGADRSFRLPCMDLKESCIWLFLGESTREASALTPHITPL